MNPGEASVLVATLKAAYPREVVEEATLAIYSAMLADLSYEEAELAVRDQVATSRFFPTIAEIRRAAAERRLGLPSATSAYEQVLAVIDGGLSVGDLPNPAKRALDLIGGTWAVRTCEYPLELRRQFKQAYDELRADAIRVEIAAPTELVFSAAPRSLEQETRKKVEELPA